MKFCLLSLLFITFFFIRAFAVVELEAHRSRRQSFEYPCLHEVVVDLKVISWCSLCCRFRLAVKYCVTAHMRTQQSSASGQTTWTRLNITENNGNVQSHNICFAKVFYRDQTSLNLTKQDTTRLNKVAKRTQLCCTQQSLVKFSEMFSSFRRGLKYLQYQEDNKVST